MVISKGAQSVVLEYYFHQHLDIIDGALAIRQRERTSPRNLPLQLFVPCALYQSPVSTRFDIDKSDKSPSKVTTAQRCEDIWIYGDILTIVFYQNQVRPISMKKTEGTDPGLVKDSPLRELVRTPVRYYLSSWQLVFISLVSEKRWELWSSCGLPLVTWKGKDWQGSGRESPGHLYS